MPSPAGCYAGCTPLPPTSAKPAIPPGALELAALLRQHELDLQAWPVLVVAGAGAPEPPGGRQVIDGVTVVMWRDSDSWRPRLTARQHLDVATAGRATDALLSYRTRRWKHDHAVA